MTTSIDNKRFIVYADFLGTEARYSTPALVVRGRELLEQALVRCVVPHLNREDMHLYVYSDTAVITCPRLDPLLQPIAELFGHFMELQGGSGNAHLTLWLRAAISCGIRLTVDHLQTSERIRTIPFLDTSLPTAYRLESIRKGSRVFADPAISDGAFVGCDELFFKWQQITGRGIYVANVREYFWPAKLYRDNDRLARMACKLIRWWTDELNSKEWPHDEYYKSKMIHLDETMKLFIRTCSVFCSDHQRKEVLFSLLPVTHEDQKNIRYKWGVWFQALRGLIEDLERNPSLAPEFASAYTCVKSILKKGEYFEHFLSELKFPDYAQFRTRLCAMGLLEND